MGGRSFVPISPLNNDVETEQITYLPSVNVPMCNLERVALAIWILGILGGNITNGIKGL